MANIPGAANPLPGAYTDVLTASRGVSIPAGSRIAAVIGEGSTDQTIVTAANGGGSDGLNSTYTSTTGADGRHFQLSFAPLVSNRTTLFKNGIPLVGLEELIDSSTFSNQYDYRIDIATGEIELQTAHLVDQGGAFYVPLSTNIGDGYISALTLIDNNAPPENWTIRCISVQRTSLNAPIAGTAKFLAFGSISGALVDANGNPFVWLSNNVVVSNGVLSFSIGDSSTVFREGDAFTIKIASGVLVRSDSLTANFIPVANLNDPVLTQGMDDVLKRHGVPSLSNNLSLGAQLAYANSAPTLLTVQAAPPMPRRTSYVLSPAINADSTNDDDFIFPLPLGVVPDFNSSIHFFTKNNTTNVESQILPNKFTFDSLGTAGQPTVHGFIVDNSSAPAGNSYFYSVTQSNEVLATGTDGYVGRITNTDNHGIFSSSISFDSSYSGKQLKVIDATNVGNVGIYNITGVSGGKLNVSKYLSPLPVVAPFFADIVAQTGITYQLIDSTGTAVDGYAATDGYTTSPTHTSTVLAKFDSTVVNFANLPALVATPTNYKLKITASTSSLNNGLYDITAIVGRQLTIKKVIVNESGMRYEILDLSLSTATNYVVINHNVVPSGYGLRITIVDKRDATFFDAGWINALAALETVECDIVVPLPKQTTSVIFQNTLSHCKSMSNIRNKKERVMFCGAISGLKPENLTGAKPAAVEDIGILEGIQGETVTDILSGNIEDLANYSVPDAFGNTFRAVYFYPDQIVVQAGTENVLVDGFYLAAAAAGYEAADIRIENPLTNKVLSGFTILRNKQFSTLTLEQLAVAGVTTLQPVAGGGRIVWGLTTTQSGFPEEQEISIVFIRDRVAKILRAGFVPFVGTPETPDTEAVLNTRAVILLNSLVSQGIITAFKDLNVRRDDVDPRQWDVSVRVQPTYPINFIYIKVSLGQI